MKIRMIHTGLGSGYLWTPPQFDYPVFVKDSEAGAREADYVYAPEDMPSGYLHRVSDWDYTEAEESWIDAYIIRTHRTDCVRYDMASRKFRVFVFGASWKNGKQLAEIERINGERMALA